MKPRGPSLSAVQRFVAKGRPTCPACRHALLPGQRIVTHQGKRHHKRCVEYEPRGVA